MWGVGFPLGAVVGYQMAAGALDPSLISVGSVAAAVGAGLVGECCILFAKIMWYYISQHCSLLVPSFAPFYTVAGRLAR